MREHLAAVSAQQEHKAGQRRTKVVDHEARQAERAQVRAKKVRNREVSNEFSRTRANLPAFDAEHEKQVKAAQQRIQDLSGAERRKAVLKQRLAEAEYRQKRLEQAKAEAEATVEAKSTVTAPVRRS
jgi:DNA repair exonuclease SbcCD ATPase subunit